MKLKLVLTAAIAAVLLAGCGSSPAPKPPSVSQIASEHGWTGGQPQAVPTYPAKKEVLFQDAAGNTVDVLLFSSNTARNKWVRDTKGQTATTIALMGGGLSLWKTVKWFQGYDWAAVDEGTLSNFP